MMNVPTNLRRPALESVLPSHFVKDYPDFVKFLSVYYEYLDSSEGLDGILTQLRDIRNVDAVGETFHELMKKEYGPSFPNGTAADDATAIKMFEYWFKSKGSQDAMEAYFRLFLNAEAEVIYPKDNILRVSDGNWDEASQRYIDGQGHLNETTMRVQDSNFYQIFSYLIRSDVSISDWGPLFTQLAHPAGWNLFGEVRLTELAQFDYLTKSPTIVPGFQTRDSNLLILGAAIFFAVNDTATSTAPKRDYAFSQFIRKYWKIVVGSVDYNLAQGRKNILSSTYPIYQIKDLTIEDFEYGNSTAIPFTRARSARIIISGP